MAIMMIRRSRPHASCVGIILAFLAIAPAAAAPQSALQPPPNLVTIDERLTTSGQPSKEWLGQLKSQGFEAVIYLVPANVPDAVRDEALVVSGQGMVFVHIPIEVANPTERDFETFAAMLTALSPRKVLVHCQINLRASTMVFLYRSIVAKEDPRTAYEAVSKVWVPDGPWQRLIQEQLHKHGIAFDPF